MLLKIYLGTTLCSWLITIVSVIELEKQVKKEGYILTKSNDSLLTKLLKLVSSMSKMSIPIINIIYAIKFQLNKKEYFEDIIFDMITSEELIRDPEIRKAEIEKMQQEYQKYMGESASYDSYAEYQSMSNLEKLKYLEAERDFLLQEREILLNNFKSEYENNKGAYRKNK